MEDFMATEVCTVSLLMLPWSGRGLLVLELGDAGAVLRFFRDVAALLIDVQETLVGTACPDGYPLPRILLIFD